MSDNIKLIQNKKFEFIDIEKESGFVSKKPSCTPKMQTIGLSVSACKELKLETFSHCNISSISPLEETSRLYLRFNNKESSKTNFKLLKPVDHSIQPTVILPPCPERRFLPSQSGALPFWWTTSSVGQSRRVCPTMLGGPSCNLPPVGCICFPLRGDLLFLPGFFLLLAGRRRAHILPHWRYSDR